MNAYLCRLWQSGSASPISLCQNAGQIGHYWVKELLAGQSCQISLISADISISISLYVVEDLLVNPLWHANGKL